MRAYIREWKIEVGRKIFLLFKAPFIPKIINNRMNYRIYEIWELNENKYHKFRVPRTPHRVRKPTTFPQLRGIPRKTTRKN